MKGLQRVRIYRKDTNAEVTNSTFWLIEDTESLSFFTVLSRDYNDQLGVAKILSYDKLLYRYEEFS